MLKKWGEQVLRSRQYAAGLALVFAFLSFFDLPVGWVSTVIIALITLQNGPRQGAIIMAWAILPAVAMLSLGHYLIFINVFLLHYFVVWGLAVLLRKNGWMNVLQVASLCGITTVVAMYFFAPDLQSSLVHQLTDIAKEYKSVAIFNLRPADFNLWLDYLGMVAMGLLALATILTNLLVVLLARGWQSMMAPLVSMQKECYNIRIHYPAAIVLVALIAGLYLNANLMINVLIIAFIPFVVAGLSLLHAYATTKKVGNIIMFVFYVLFLFLSPYLMMLLSLMGWVDSFVNFRKRFVVENAVVDR
jgi:hypothetical protein